MGRNPGQPVAKVWAHIKFSFVLEFLLGESAELLLKASN